MTKWLPGAAFILSAAMIIEVGCTSNPAGPPPPPPPTLSPTTAPQSASTTDPLTASVAEPIPAIGGFSGTFREAANNAPPGATVSLTSYMHAPANAPAPQAVRRAMLSGPRAQPLAAGPRTAIFWVSQTYSARVTFDAFPITVWQVPSGLTGPFELETFDATASGMLDVEVDTSVNGTSVTFPGSSTAFPTIVGHTYWWELLTGPTPMPTPSSSPTPTPTSTPTATPTPTPTPTPAPTPTPPPVTEFALPAGSNPWGITVGPDGALWFTENGATNNVGRITLAGAITEFPIPAGPTPSAAGITLGPDGNLWFVEHGRNMVTKLTTAGVFTEYPIPTASSAPAFIATGPDGNLWFTEQNGNNIGRITPKGSITEFPVPTTGAQPFGITAGPDGAMWFMEAAGHKIGRITTTGVITNEYGGGVGYGAITTGPDGNLWFAATGRSVCRRCFNWIGKVTTAGTVSYYTFTAGGFNRPPNGIAAGPDGNLWFTVPPTNQIGRITTTGSSVLFGGLSPGAGPYLITAGPNGDPHMWFTDFNGSRIGEIHT